MDETVGRREIRLSPAGLRRLAKRSMGSAFFRSDLMLSLLTAKNYISSYYGARRQRAAFQGVSTYCMFIGHMKSGGSMIGSLLDAHPNAILADEVDALHYVQAGFAREQIFHVLLRASQKELAKGRVTARRLGAYSWLVPGQWQGRYSTLQVIGESATGISTLRLGRTPGLLQKLRQTMRGVRVKFIHVIRNPYDPISLMMLRGRRTFEAARDHYFRSCQILVGLRSSLDDASLLSMRYEDFIAQPEQSLVAVCRFLGLDAGADYLAACHAILRKAPDRSRALVQWEPGWIEQVQERMAAFGFLAGYSFEDQAAGYIAKGQL